MSSQTTLKVTKGLIRNKHHICRFRENSIQCPFDRQPTSTGESGVLGLKKNFALIELLEELQRKGSPTSNADPSFKEEEVIMMI